MKKLMLRFMIAAVRFMRAQTEMSDEANGKDKFIGELQDLISDLVAELGRLE